jgi:hypothetical protein
MGKAEDIARSRKTDGFLVYEDKNLSKINSIRRVISAPDAKLPPILNNGQVSFSAASEAHNEPRSCYNCRFYNFGKSCKLMSPELKIKKLVWPPEATEDSKQIEYWPVCSYWIYGEPKYGAEERYASINPEDAGLCWINAPEMGLERSGSCCSGANGGDDCDFFMTPVEDKRKVKFGFCRVLQRETAGLDCCSAWL